jgi:hypothetical protein
MTRHLLAALCALAATLCLAAAGSPAPAFGATLAARPDTLATVLATAKAGDQVQLAAGAYGPLTIKTGRFAEPVTVEPAPGAVAEVRGLYVIGVEGWVFRGLTFGRNPASLYLVNVASSRNVRFEGNRVKGDLSLADGIKAVGFQLRASQDIVVKGNDVSEVGQGIAHIDCDDGLLIDGNAIHDLHGNTDGVRGNSSDARVTNNRFWNFFTTGTWHADAIQWWTDGRTVPPKNILVGGNVFRRGMGNAIQGGFFGNHPEAGDLPYGAGIVIRDNLFEGTIWAGISVTRADDPLIEGNTVIGFDDVRDPRTGGLITPRISINASKGGRIFNNVAPNFLTTSNVPEVIQSGNRKIAVSAAGDLALADAWLAARAGETPAPAPADPRDAEIAALTAQVAVLSGRVDALSAQLATATTDAAALSARIDRLLAERAWTLAKAIEARKAKAKNAVIDQIVTTLSAPAP